MSISTIGKKSYILGKQRSTGFYCIWKKQRGKWIVNFTTSDFSVFQSQIKKMKNNSEKAEARSMIACMAGTSYKEACIDMGLTRI
jgi:hypothetical protein